ncbi:MAG: YbhB/YbcL family Raf kinase inhibitor-like protein [Bacteroidota bacterium]
MKLFLSAAALLATTALSAQTFTLKSNDIGGQATQKQFANTFGCTGENISPELHWEHAPAEAKYFAVTMYDKDAPTGSGLWHWTVFNIPASVKELKTGTGDLSKNLTPAGAVQGITDLGHAGYGGPCPNPGPAHQYIITVYALKDKLPLDEKASSAIVGFYLNTTSIARASIVMYGQR